MCYFRGKFASTYVHHMHWHGRQTRSWQQDVTRKCLHMAAMVVFSSSLTTAVKMNVSSPMPSVHLADSPLSSAVTTGVHEHAPLLLESEYKLSKQAVVFTAVLISNNICVGKRKVG